MSGRGKVWMLVGLFLATGLLGGVPAPLPGGDGEAAAQSRADRARQRVDRRERAAQRLRRQQRIEALRRVQRATVRRVIRYRISRAIAERRKAAIRTLIRNRLGAWVMRHQILALAPEASALERLRPLGFRVARIRRFEALDLEVTVLRTPPELEPDAALALARKTLPDIRFEAHHLFDPSGGGEAPDVTAAMRGRLPWEGLPAADGLKIGQVDLGVDVGHPALADASIAARAFTETDTEGEAPAASAHGTAVASLLVGRLGAFGGASEGATLYAADVFGDADSGGSVEAILAALDWMAAEHVPVVAMPLAGPRNLVVEMALDRATARGMLVVAPVGNDGPTRPVAWPAAHPAVIAVTATDSDGKVYLTAHRGPEVMLAAVGVALPAAGDPGSLRAVEGTSFAVPEVASRLLRLHDAQDPGTLDRAIAALLRTARDLGEPGRDPVYGAGWVSYAAPPRAAGVTSQRVKE